MFDFRCIFTQTDNEVLLMPPLIHCACPVMALSGVDTQLVGTQDSV